MDKLYSLYFMAQLKLNTLPKPKADNAALTSILNIVFAIVGSITFLIIVIGGLRYILAAGDPGKMAQAKKDDYLCTHRARGRSVGLRHRHAGRKGGERMRRALALVVVSLLLAVSAAPMALAAYNPIGNACKGVSDSPTCNSASSTTDNPLTGTNGVLLNIANLIAIVAGIAAVIMIIIAGIQYMTAAGDSQKAATARKIIIGAVVGIVFIVAARFIITIVVKGVSG